MATRLTVIPRYEEFEIPVVIDSTEGIETEVRTFRGYVRGDGCPVPIMIETDELFTRYFEEDYPTPEKRESMSDQKFLTESRRAELTLRRDLLCMVLPGLDMDTANILANSEEGRSVLVKLGWFSEPSLSTEEEKEDAEGEVERVDDETGE